MKTKIFIASLFLLFTSIYVQAQDAGKTSFGILGGVNFQNLTGTDYGGDKLENNMNLGFHAGVNVQVPVAPEFYFQPGLMFIKKGAKDEDAGETTSIGISYIEVPLNLVYKGLLGKGHVLLGFGPYLAYGIGGKVKDDNAEVDIEFKSTIEAGDDLTKTYLKPLDAGANIFAGYELSSGIFFQFNTELGLLKINPGYDGDDNDETAIKNTGFGLSLGYRF